jgi:hypothetical protein
MTRLWDCGTILPRAARSKASSKRAATGVELDRNASLWPHFAVNPCEAPCSNRGGLRVEPIGWQAA